MIPLAVPNLSGREAEYLQDCIESTFVSSVGPFVDRFEAMVAELAGSKGAVATSSGTTGLHLALTAIGVSHNDLVICPSFTFIASGNAIAHCGAMPWLLDVCPENWTLDAAKLAEALQLQARIENGKVIHSDSGRRVAAILPVYTLGEVPNMGEIRAVADRYGLPIVADAACALGTTYGGRSIGSLAEATVFSFNGNKTFTAGGGGAVAANDEELIQLCRHLSTTARVGRDYDHDRVGFNYRMTNINAAVGCAQLERAEEFLASKRKISSRYNAELASLPGLEAFPAADWGKGGCWFSGVSVDPSRIHLPELIAHLQSCDIQSRTFWKPLHLQQPYKDCPVEDLPVSNEVWRQILTLPCSTHLTDAEQMTVIKQVRDYIGSIQ